MHVRYNVHILGSVHILLQCPLQFSGVELTYIHVSLYFRAAYAMLIAARLPKDTDVSFITEMIEVCNQPFNSHRDQIYNIYFASNINYYLKIVTLESAATAVRESSPQ